MSKTGTFVIVGGGLAGARAAQTLREEGFDGGLVVIGDEPERPYERPPLSKGLLTGAAEPDSVYVHDALWYAEHDVDLRTAVRAVAVDRADGEVQLADGQRIRYDKLLLATGSRPRDLAAPGVDLDGVLRLRTLADSRRIAATLVDGAHIVIIGAGWIGLEVAAAARQRGATVDIVETAALPLRRVLGDEIAQVFANLHRDHGVTIHFGAEVREIRGTDRVSSVLLADGTEVPADAMVVAVGVQPNTELATAAGLTVENGIVVDASLRTADPEIYAAGDVANAYHPVLRRRLRVEHWANALHGGAAVARAMLGQPVSYDDLPYFYTDQYDLGMEYVGHAPPEAFDRVVVRGDVAKREFIAFWTTGGRVLAGMNVNVWDVVPSIRRLVAAAQPVDLERLADPAVPLDELLPPPAAQIG
ncbi:3-phenylpropionate/trans-cinnamate dioxygenase ferredoxin reductase subunit [Micromonospora coriariae]|uniref:3-phenylpropionate/trans-cinnamate dioxygenase ferredoxin reductase subunit n=1 Tax=Micromonospora coriariae TaxID=285665 RepID=A0A1C4Y7Y6_9ACTN|nr:FAD-dependent oxidoreductase [Micromonospora coriariae]SCF16838.1 3-phenylpropionate/trans-cinnamate dioxygenase ferredoxin reductase subunit [Micromonospora coriariae]